MIKVAQIVIMPLNISIKGLQRLLLLMTISFQNQCDRFYQVFIVGKPLKDAKQWTEGHVKRLVRSAMGKNKMRICLNKIKIQVFDIISLVISKTLHSYASSIVWRCKLRIYVQLRTLLHVYITCLTNILNDYDQFFSVRLEGSSTVYYTIFCCERK